jgi:hypothetical protein
MGPSVIWDGAEEGFISKGQKMAEIPQGNDKMLPIAPKRAAEAAQAIGEEEKWNAHL